MHYLNIVELEPQTATLFEKSLTKGQMRVIRSQFTNSESLARSTWKI